ncbi:MAG: hypothetical protein WAU47_14875 [Desulfobaccales bacterium]
MSTGVLFICLGNSCRSIMAEALARHLYPGEVKAASAGINPLGFVTEETFQVLAEMGIATQGLWSKGFEEVNLSEFSLLINLTSYPLDSHLPGDLPGRIISYPVTDPFGGSLAMYREARDSIRRFITEDLSTHLRNL